MKKILLFLVVANLLCLSPAIAQSDGESFDHYTNIKGGLFLVVKDRKYGAINKKGNVVISPKYDGLGWFIDGVSVFKMSNESTDTYAYGVVNDKGVEIVPKGKYGAIGTFKNGLAKVYSSSDDDDASKVGYINNKGVLVIPMTFDHQCLYCADFNKLGVASLGKNIDSETVKFGVINKAGKTVIRFEYDYISIGTGEYDAIWAKKDGKQYLFSSSGKLLTSLSEQFDHVFSFSQSGNALVRKDDKYGSLNVKGDIVVPVVYDDAETWSESDTLAYIKDKKGYLIDITNNKSILKDVPCDGVNGFGDSFASFARETKDGMVYALVDRSGTFIFPFVAKSFDPFIYDEYSMYMNGLPRVSEDRFGVTVNGKMGLIDAKGKEIAKPIFDWVGNFESGVALAKKDGKFMIIDLSGSCVLICP